MRSTSTGDSFSRCGYGDRAARSGPRLHGGRLDTDLPLTPGDALEAVRCPTRPDAAVPNLLVRSDGRPVTEGTVTELFKAVRRKVGFRVYAHKFRHRFASEYLRNGGDIERLRRILGHRTCMMVMRYVHLNKCDLAHGFDERSPF